MTDDAHEPPRPDDESVPVDDLAPRTDVSPDESGQVTGGALLVAQPIPAPAPRVASPDSKIIVPCV